MVEDSVTVLDVEKSDVVAELDELEVAVLKGEVTVELDVMESKAA